jgi:hypothetical protein
MAPMSNQRPSSAARARARPSLNRSAGAALALATAVLVGCSAAPPPTRTGFLTNYSSLARVSDTRMRYISPEMREYQSFIVDPVQMTSRTQRLKPEHRSEIAAYFTESLERLLKSRGYTVTDRAGSGTARVRVALTDISESTWWQKMHPASSLAGAGRGGAAMEGEIVDSVSGEQLAAVVQSGVGSQFTVGNYSTVADIKNVIDQWVKTAGDRFDEMQPAGR